MAIVLSFIATVAHAQSTMGSDFWTSFMPNSSSEAEELNLIATGARACSGTVTNPNTNWSTNFTVTPGNVTTINIPKTQGYNHNSSESPVNIGLHITTTDSISLYASNFRPASFDVTGILPTPSLGDEYLIQAFPYSSTDRCAELSIIAVENNTVVDINLSCSSIGGHTANVPFSVTLNAGQCYQILTNVNQELSGTHIQAQGRKKIAVLAGARSANVPSGTYTYADHLVEQMMPVTTWGNHFVVTQSMLRNNDVIRVTSLSDNCQICKNGTVIATINAGQTHQFEITSAETSCYLETTQPAAVFLYLTCQSYGGTNGDPSMVIINPIEQQIEEITFSTFNSGNSSYHFVNIVTDTDKVSGMTLDGANIASQFTPVASNADYSFARVEIQHGSHHIANNNGAFVAHVYGLGSAQSYAYSVGSMAINLTSQMTIENIPTSQLPNGYTICQGETVHFGLQLNYTPSMANWNFGDGTTGAGSTVNHTYNTPGHYTVTCDIYQLVQGQNTWVATLNSVINVFPNVVHDLYQEACDNYTWNGQTYTQSGNYTYHGLTPHRCDSTAILHLTINPSYTTDLSVETCNNYTWYGQTYSQSGTYQHLLQSSEGCDSLLILHLTIGQSFTYEETVEACEMYHWHGQDYTQSGTYNQTVQGTGGCDSTFVLHLTIYHDVTHTLDQTACDSYTWNGQTYTQSGQYTYHGMTSHRCDSTVFLNLTINPSYTTDLNVETCDDYTWYGQTYDETGSYEHLLQSTEGCDSLLILHLTIGQGFTSEESADACNSYIWHGNTYTQSGIYTDQVAGPDGCDSTFVLNLNLGYDIVTDTIANVCQEYTWYGQTYYESGEYEHHLQTIMGCDSLVILKLNLGDVATMEENITSCNSYTWRGHTYTESGYYSETVENPDGCDTIYSLNLRIGHDAANDTIAMTCYPFTWYGQTYTESGDYTHLLLTPLGCDSLVTLHFTIGDVVTNEIEASVCDQYPWPWAPDGFLTESGEYSHTLPGDDGCDSIISLSLIVNHAPQMNVTGPTHVVAATNMMTGTYVYHVTDTLNIEPNSLEWVCSNPDWLVTPLGNGYSCRLTVTTIGQGALKATSHNSTGCDSSGAIEISATYFDIDENEVQHVRLFPNPAQTKVTIEATDLTQILLIDALGQVVMSNEYESPESATLNIGRLPSGVYFVKIATKAGTAVRRLVVAR